MMRHELVQQMQHLVTSRLRATPQVRKIIEDATVHRQPFPNLAPECDCTHSRSGYGLCHFNREAIPALKLEEACDSATIFYSVTEKLAEQINLLPRKQLRGQGR